MEGKQRSKVVLVAVQSYRDDNDTQTDYHGMAPRYRALGD